ncbi:carboxylesterase family protein [Xanthomonas sp. WHRI 1810A]|uniref:carboxylesterase/lipase family protein n=1 Tax=Xanthomonas sp. WHRI 1810A TaxID=3161565 RepID=UPI0032E8EBA9
MKYVKSLSSVVLMTALASQVAQAAVAVQTEAGAVAGVVNKGVEAFKGIPFAAAPVGPLRWRAPQPATPWTGVKTADRYGSDCMQKPVANDAAPLGTPPSEDCLYLNVWKPAQAAKKQPVMVWIYGGGFLNGGASTPVYSGEPLAREGIVVVSFNYRVGRFGFFAHPQLDKQRAGKEPIGNYGFMDQIAALEWVKRNIASFGGDPDNVTLVGESAGGMSVHTLLTSPKSQGLFQKAVIQSGGDGNLMMSDLNTAQQAGTAFALSQGIAADDAHAVEKLRALPADAIRGNLNMMTLFQKPSGPPTFTLPLYDGHLAVDAVKAYHAGDFAHVPVMVGATTDDLLGPDGAMVKGARSVADLLSSKGVPVYRYRFGYVAESLQAQQPQGARHASEIPYFFGTAATKLGEKMTERDRNASQIANGYLVNFIKAGNPNSGLLPDWPVYTPTSRSTLDFTAQGSASASW